MASSCFELACDMATVQDHGAVKAGSGHSLKTNRARNAKTTYCFITATLPTSGTLILHFAAQKAGLMQEQAE
jgi:hypothetical protein